MSHLLHFRRNHPACTAEGLRIVAVHNQQRVLAFYRFVPGEGREVFVVVNFHHQAHRAFRLGFPHLGAWKEAFNSDVYDHYLNPWRQGNGGGIVANGDGLHGLPTSAEVYLPANSVLVFTRG